MGNLMKTFALMAVLTVHLVLHWKWIVCVTQGKPVEGAEVVVVAAICEERATNVGDKSKE